MLKQGVGNGQQLAHAGGQGYLLGLARSTEVQIETGDDLGERESKVL